MEKTAENLVMHMMADSKKMKGHEVCGNGSVMDNGSCTSRNGKNINFVDDNSTTIRRQAGSNDEISAKEENVNSLVVDSATNPRGAGSINEISTIDESYTNRCQARSNTNISSEEEATVFEWKGESLEDYWRYTLNAITWYDDDGKGQCIDIIVDDGSNKTLLIHEVKKAEDLSLKDVTLPEPTSTGKQLLQSS